MGNRLIFLYLVLLRRGVLTHDQQRRLLSQLARTKTPWTCPHGRPTVVAFDRRRLDGMFGR